MYLLPRQQQMIIQALRQNKESVWPVFDPGRIITKKKATLRLPFSGEIEL